MIVPMKKVLLIIPHTDKEQALKKLRRMGILHIEEMQGSGERLAMLRDRIALLDQAVFTVSGKSGKKIAQQAITAEEALAAAERIISLSAEFRSCTSKIALLTAESDRLKGWGDVDTSEILMLSERGIKLSLYEMPLKEYKALENTVTTVMLNRIKNTVRFVTVGESGDESDIAAYRVKLPEKSTDHIRREIAELEKRVHEIKDELSSYSVFTESMKCAAEDLQKETLLEVYSTGMSTETLSDNADNHAAVSYFSGFIPAEELDSLKSEAAANSWGLIADDPTEDDNVPTKLKNNKFISLIYPLTDFLGTVPGYFEYDISGWFLGFILIFFGIIFGDGGYGLLICTAAAVLITRSYITSKTVPPAYLLVGLLGVATVLWGTLTCTWFGLSPDMLPKWLRSFSIPIISNVNADRIWYPFWTNGKAGLTTAQNVQIFCFSLALVQLTAAHLKGMVRNRNSLKMLSDLGSILQLMGIFYVVLSLVVNGAVFGLSQAIGGIPVGTAAIALIGIGFAMSFIFANYEGSIGRSVLDSLKNIVSVLLGVVNVFSDIVSYIRLWAVGLAGAAISATVNELAGPLFGDLMFIAVAVILLVFGHGLNMILNILSVIVHGVRLNTLEFSSHLDMSWSGHKFDPFKE